jgi:hypothetical protein
LNAVFAGQEPEMALDPGFQQKLSVEFQQDTGKLRSLTGLALPSLG